MLSERRIEQLHINDDHSQGKYVLYWMQGAQRVHDNHALEFAILKANQLQVPLIVAFVVIPDFPDANTRHFLFMLQGILEVSEALKAKGIGFYLNLGKPYEIISHLATNSKALILDKGYRVYERDLRAKITQETKCDVFEVDTNLVVPVDHAYPKEAYAAYAIRPSIMRQLDDFNVGCEAISPKVPFNSFEDFELDAGIFLGTPKQFIIDHLSHLEKLPQIESFIGGTSQALKQLELFVKEKLFKYEDRQSNPEIQGTSKLSPYLHFGQISPITILRSAGNTSKGFVEQLVVRRELAYNYIYFAGTSRFTLKDTLPTWAYQTLMEHASDPREYLYPLEVLERGETHDPYWNAAQHEMVYSGHMHNTMRMYWGKKVIEWTAHPDIAFAWMQYLNDKYSLDGRDPNGYAGIAWCFGKHDRPWKERPIFGKVRYMNDKGLIRKYNMAEYIAYVAQLRGANFE